MQALPSPTCDGGARFEVHDVQQLHEVNVVVQLLLAGAALDHGSRGGGGGGGMGYWMHGWGGGVGTGTPLGCAAVTRSPTRAAAEARPRPLFPVRRPCSTAAPVL